MLHTEIRHREGMPYGGMPNETILLKLEETDPELVAGGSTEEGYGDYVRSEIIDWAPDAPYLESDKPRRDPGISRGALNLRYNGTRGTNPELPRHPELFLGFTGDDPRGVNNEPRFEQMRGQMASRTADLTVRMGDSDDHQLAESPWMNQAISRDKQKIWRRQKADSRIFTAQKDGRPLGNNTAAAGRAGALRPATIGAAGETFGGPGGAARFTGGDHGHGNEAQDGGVRGVDGGHAPGAETAPWRHSTGDGDLGVQRYGQKRGAGRALVAPAAQGGGRLAASRAEQAWAESARAQSTNSQSLGATMALAARHRRATRGGTPDQDPGRPGAGYEVAGAPGGGLAPARDVARLLRSAVEDQARRAAGEVQDGDGGALGGAAGLMPAANPGRASRAGVAQGAAHTHLTDRGSEVTAGGLAPAANPERAIRAGVAQVTPNAHLTDLGAIVAGLREGTAAARRRIAGNIVADGARRLAASEVEAGATGAGLTPGADLGRVARMAEAPLARSAAAEGLTVHAYSSAPRARSDRRAAHAKRADEGGSTWSASREALPLGSSKPAEWRSHTQAQSRLGDEADRVFGFDADVAGYTGTAAMGSKSLRAGGWSSSAGLTDGGVGGFGDGVATSA